MSHSIAEKKRRLANTIDTLESVMDEIASYNLNNSFLTDNFRKEINCLYNVDLNRFLETAQEAETIIALSKKLITIESNRRKKQFELEKDQNRLAIRKIALAKKESKSQRELPTINLVQQEQTYNQQATYSSCMQPDFPP